MRKILKPVGRGGRNLHDDVLVVQDLLNDHLEPPLRFLEEDGIIGLKTIEAIRDFQRRVVCLKNPDGRVDPGHMTIQNLNGLSATGSWKPPAPEVPTGFGPSHISKHKSAARKAFKDQGKEHLWKEFWAFAVNDATPEVKRFFNLIGRAEEARMVARFWIVLKEDLKAPTSEMKQIFQTIMKIGKPKWTADFIEHAVAAPATKAGQALGFLKKVGGSTALKGLIFTIEYIDHCQKGDYHMALVDIYKEFMGEGVKWAGWMDTIQSFLAACLPKSYQTEKINKIVKAINPIDLGAQAVDTAGTAISMLAEMAFADKIDSQRANRLADRVKKSSAAVFYDIGDDLADALAQMADMPDEEFSEMLTMNNIFDWIKSSVTVSG